MINYLDKITLINLKYTENYHLISSRVIYLVGNMIIDLNLSTIFSTFMCHKEVASSMYQFGRLLILF